MTKPLIGAVNGVAITGGFELALNCDFLVASERAKFGDTHTRVGVMPGWGLTVLLPQAIGVRRAREMSFTGNFMLAEEALHFGLVNHVVPTTTCCRSPASSPPTSSATTSPACARSAPPTPRSPTTSAGWEIEATNAGRWQREMFSPEKVEAAASHATRRQQYPRRPPGQTPIDGRASRRTGGRQMAAPRARRSTRDCVGDVEREDLGAVLVEVEAVVGAHVLALRRREGRSTYSAQPPLTPGEAVPGVDEHHVRALRGLGPHHLVLHPHASSDVGVVVVGDAHPDERAVPSAEVVHHLADSASVLGTPLGVVGAGHPLDRPRLVDVAQALRVVAAERDDDDVGVRPPARSGACAPASRRSRAAPARTTPCSRASVVTMPVSSSRLFRYGPNVPASESPSDEHLGRIGGRRHRDFLRPAARWSVVGGSVGADGGPVRRRPTVLVAGSTAAASVASSPPNDSPTTQR